jgi:hypothetical protein
VSEVIQLKVNTSVSVEATVTRANGSIEPRGHISNSATDTPRFEEPLNPTTSQIFYFSDRDWRAKPVTCPDSSDHG